MAQNGKAATNSSTKTVVREMGEVEGVLGSSTILRSGMDGIGKTTRARVELMNDGILNMLQS